MNSLHHARLFRADSVSSLELPVCDGSFEVDNCFVEKFGIDDARELVRKTSNTPTEAEKQLLVVRTNFITLEAQNSLLKVLEEPPVSTLFVFVVPHDFVVLPTLASRFSFQDLEEVELSQQNEEFELFLNSSYKERIALIDQSAKKQDSAWQRMIKQGLIKYLSSDVSLVGKSLKELEYVARLLLTRGASNKMLLEQAALIIPVR